MDKVSLFLEEIEYIKNPSIKQFIIEAIECLPDYFFTIPASSTGKYHPSYALGEGGLLRHTKAAIGIAIQLFNINTFTDDEKDCIIAALILHDGFKSGIEQSQHTVHEHPLLMANFIMENARLVSLLDNADLINIVLSISSHMGQWTTSTKSSVVLPTPKNKVQRFVHMCDYLASRKCLDYNFDL